VTAVPLVLDTSPPALPSLVVASLDGGVLTLSAGQVVMVRLACSVTPVDLAGEYKIWGDVDPTAYGAIQATELASSWVTYSDPLIPIKLSTGAGVKSLHGRLRDDLRNPTAVLTSQVYYDPTYPEVQVVSLPDRTHLSVQDGFRVCSFTWAPSVDVVEYQLRAVPSLASSHLAGSPVGTASGSSGVAGTGSYLAGVPMSTSIDAADLANASPGDGPKVAKVFVRDSAGRWSL
jgi:hypothetical protein